MNDAEPQYWFRAKRFGFGWGLPATWQGWVSLGAYVTAILGPLAFGEKGTKASVGALVVGTPAFVYLCYRKGEPARWRWGNK
jgi:hypothetical protein